MRCRATVWGRPAWLWRRGIRGSIRCHTASGNSQEACFVSGSGVMDVLLGLHFATGRSIDTMTRQLLDRLLARLCTILTSARDTASTRCMREVARQRSRHEVTDYVPLRTYNNCTMSV